MKYPSFAWLLLFPGLLVISLYLSWQVLASQNFLYGFFYDHTELEEFIEYFAPMNRYKPEFQYTNREERIRLFSEVLKSVEDEGKGLEKIVFYSSQGKRLGVLFHEREINHLRLVSSLIEKFKWFAYLNFFIVFCCIWIILGRRIQAPEAQRIVIAYTGLLIVVIALVMLISPARIFTLFHQIFFPETDQWFFYYQDSLMTTLMMAPKLFGYFAMVWSLLACVFFLALGIVVWFWLSKSVKKI